MTDIKKARELYETATEGHMYTSLQGFNSHELAADPQDFNKPNIGPTAFLSPQLAPSKPATVSEIVKDVPPPDPII